MDTAAVLGDAMTDYLLAVGAKAASAARAPEHMAEWLDAHRYRIVRVPVDIEAGDPGEADLVDLITALIDMRSCCQDGADRCSILRQALAAGQPAPTDAGWRDDCPPPGESQPSLASGSTSGTVARPFGGSTPLATRRQQATASTQLPDLHHDGGSTPQTALESDMSMVSMSHDEKTRLRTAAFRVTRLYPGPVGELLSRELLTWEEFGYRLGGRQLIMRLVDHVMTTPHIQSDAA